MSIAMRLSERTPSALRRSNPALKLEYVAIPLGEGERDKTGTECLRCQRSGRKCIPAPTKPEEVTFRHGQNPSLRPKGPPRYGESDLAFPDDQVWVKTPPDVDFEDETDRTAADYHVIPVETPTSVFEAAPEGRSSSGAAFSSPAIVNAANPSPSPTIPRWSGIAGQFTPNMTDSLLPPDALVSRQKLASLNEAFLLRHFRNSLGAWLDVSDHEMHFSVDVVERAPSCPLLLYACLAIAARHLSHTKNSVPPNIADEYHERCIAILLPALENGNFSISIEVVLASTVILRFFEQISSHVPSNDQQRHLLAGSVYFSSQVDCAISGGLAGASFWIFLRQDIQFALSHHNPLRLTLNPFGQSLCGMWESKNSLAERDWAHMATWLLAETINFCYGAHHQMRLDTVDGDELKRKIRTWELEKPETFQPLHFSHADRHNHRPFPVIWYTTPLHATAIQHICLAKALLLEHELHKAHAGNAPEHIVRRIKQDDILTNLGILFGIALSTDDDPSVRIMAGHALCACGSWILDPLAQNCLLALLRKTEAENGWPWAFEVQKLSHDWGFTAT
ncbi:hypothetical protein CNMCM5793_005516 [Aspergillus hiratsukae]|uniref:Zn(II)2Cys6 transcription factor n=1 Tax=Aspergillus hiratsukae TaxID=1194566 RepID=A0A8H6PG31_9EURO|nr:hypothetical protein CNMCM5793_005516 [Aspergillus hiratsukae]KAF7171958.1 hypothetical protein CNMCM6106_006271 [Aspergillus hiratsukae]